MAFEIRSFSFGTSNQKPKYIKKYVAKLNIPKRTKQSLKSPVETKPTNNKATKDTINNVTIIVAMCGCNVISILAPLLQADIFPKVIGRKELRL